MSNLSLITNWQLFHDWNDINKTLKSLAAHAGYVEKAFVEYKGKYSIIKELLTITDAIKNEQECSLAYLSNIYQDYKPIKDLRLCTFEEWKNHSYQRDIEGLERLLQEKNSKITLLETAYNSLKTGSNTTNICEYGPCIKSQYGICDGECDYSG